jgi:putative flippase GtrA
MSLLTRVRHEFLSAQFARFLLAGGIALVLHWLSRYALNFVMPFTPAIVLAYFVGIAAGYLLNKHLVFQGSVNRQSVEMRYFVLVNLAGLPVVWLIATFLTYIVLPRLGIVQHAPEIAHAIAITFPIFINFLAHKYITFKTLAFALKE